MTDRRWARAAIRARLAALAVLASCASACGDELEAPDTEVARVDAVELAAGESGDDDAGAAATTGDDGGGDDGGATTQGPHRLRIARPS